MYVDYKELNKRAVKGVHPLPQPDEMRDQLTGSTVFSSLDLTNGYWQLPLHARLCSFVDCLSDLQGLLHLSRG